MHPNEPWISPGAVQFCATHLSRNQAGLEWGSGRSTRWYGERLARLLSIEFNPDWHADVNENIKDLPDVECRLIRLEHPSDQPTKPDYDPLPKYVAVAKEFPDNSLDFVVVDGHYRQACVKQALTKLKPGGLLLVDDFWFLPLPEWGVPSSWPVVHKSNNSYKSTIIFRKLDA
jgi:predicted O-methyltransferase YrrM